MSQIEALFHEIVDLPPQDRAERLRARCANDLELVRQVESLVQAYDHLTTLFGPIESTCASRGPVNAPDYAPSPPTHPRYRIGREIGRGGMGVVYLATDLQLDRAVALKFLPASLSDEAARTRLLAEARAAAILDHPNVATIYDVGESDDGRLFMAMAYCPGESLRARLARGPLEAVEAIRIATQVGDGLAAAHLGGIVHRDIKPGNLLFAAPDLVKIVDFGIAERTDPERTRGGEIAGTVAYMSPEQARGAPVDARTDIWSLGVVLFEMLTGRRPFAGDSTLPLLHAILHDRAPRLPDGVARTAGGLQRVLDRALAKDADARYPTAEHFVRDLRTATSAERRVVLPAYLTSFVGRQRELAQARSTLLSARLVTLTGAPGTGKTRLAIQVSSELGQAFPDGQVFVPLAPLEDPTLLAPAIAQALEIGRTGDLPPLEAIKAHLADKRLLLILDNFEHMLAAAPLVSELVSTCSGLTALVTSRACLRLSGERELTVPPLAVPERRDEADSDAILSSDAVALFGERAAATQPGFGLDGQNAVTIAEICRRLDGLPLAIELAAARVKLLPPRAILARLESRLDLLKGGTRDAPTRHQTLRQAIAWSYGLLGGHEKRLLRRIAVFVGGFTFEAAESVAVDLELGVLDALASLVDNNLLYQDKAHEAEPRFAMLETIREFSLECLRASGEEAEARRAHAQYYLRFVERATNDLTGPRQAERFGELEEEHDNIRGALEWSLQSADIEVAARTAVALWRFWLVRGHLHEGLDRISRILAASSEASPHRLMLLTATGTLAHNLGDYDGARVVFEDAVQRARATGDVRAIAGTLDDLGWIAWRQGDYAAARSLSVESLELHRQLEDERGASKALNNLAWIEHHEGNFCAAERLHREVLQVREAAADKRAIGFSQTNLAWALIRQSRLAEAADLLQRARALLEEIGERQLLAFSGVILATCQRAAGDLSAAVATASESAQVFRRIGDRYGLAAALTAGAAAAADAGDYDRAVGDAAESLQLRRHIGDRWGEAETLAVQARVAAGSGRPEEALERYQQALTLWAGLGDKAAMADSLEVLATLTAGADGAAAAQFLAAAALLRDALDWRKAAAGPPAPRPTRTATNQPVPSIDRAVRLATSLRLPRSDIRLG